MVGKPEVILEHNLAGCKLLVVVFSFTL